MRLTTGELRKDILQAVERAIRDGDRERPDDDVVAAAVDQVAAILAAADLPDNLDTEILVEGRGGSRQLKLHDMARETLAAGGAAFCLTLLFPLAGILPLATAISAGKAALMIALVKNVFAPKIETLTPIDAAIVSALLAFQYDEHGRRRPERWPTLESIRRQANLGLEELQRLQSDHETRTRLDGLKAKGIIDSEDGEHWHLTEALLARSAPRLGPRTP